MVPKMLAVQEHIRIHVHAVEAQAHPFVAGRVELKLVTVPRRPTDRVPDGASDVSSVRRVKGEGWLPVRAGGHCHHSILTHASQYPRSSFSMVNICEIFCMNHYGCHCSNLEY